MSEVSGYTCKRGVDYAAQEAVAPERMVTAMLSVSGCLEPVSAKTQRPVVVLAFLLWLGNRLVHVAANQNKNPLG